MKIIDVSFLSQQTNQILNEAVRRLSKISLPIKDLKKIARASTTGIISVEKAIKWIEILPAQIAYRVATKKLKDFQIWGAERDFFENRKWRAKEALCESDLRIQNPLADNAWTKAVIDSRQLLGSVKNNKAKFILLDQLISNPMMKKIAAFSNLDCGGYHIFWDHNNDGEYYPLFSRMDTPLNLANERHLTPVEVLADSIEIQDLVKTLTYVNRHILHKREDQYYHNRDKQRNPILDRTILEDRIYSFSEKYPVLRDRESTDFLWYLHNHYSMTPDQIIARFGYEILCVPFDLKENTDWISGEADVPKNWNVNNDSKISSLQPI